MINARYKVAVLPVILAFVSIGLFMACQQAPGSRQAEGHVQDRTEEETPHPPIRQQLLAEGAATAFFWDSTSTVAVVADTLLRVDGYLTLEVDQSYRPSNMRTSLMLIDILEYPLLARIDAFDVHAGQSIEVFSGALSVRKAYESPWDDIDTLRVGDLYMINKDIDLSEKERLDDTAFGLWWKDYRRAESQ